MLGTLVYAVCRWLREQGQPGDQELCDKVSQFFGPPPQPLEPKDLQTNICFSPKEVQRFEEALRETGIKVSQ